MRRLTEKQQTYLIAIGLLVITAGVYWRALGNDFVNFDDFHYVTRNAMVEHGLTAQSFVWSFNVGHASNWHPLTWMSHMLDVSLFGMKPMGHHAVSLLLHLASTVLVFLILGRITKSQWKSAFVAALFAVHPLHVESVAWIAERKDVLSTFFWLLTMGAYILYTERPSLRRYLAVVALFALGLMSKPMLVTLPLILLLMDYWPLGRLRLPEGKSKKKAPWQGWRLVREKIPLLALSGCSSVLTFIAQRRGEAVSPLGLVDPGVRISNALVACATYIVKMFWPSKLAVFYPHPMQSLPSWEIAGAALLLICISALVCLARRRAPYLVFGWLWYLVTLIPVIGLVQVGAQAMADRYTYVPLIGLFVMPAWGVPGLLRMGEWENGGEGEREKGRSQSPINHQPSTINHVPANTEHRTPNTYARCLAVISVAVILALSAGSWIQVGYWKDSITLFDRALSVTENNYTAYSNLGSAYAELKDYKKAEYYYVEALSLRTDQAYTHYDYANTLYMLGKVDQAIAEYQEALRLEPEFDEARRNLETAVGKQENARRAAEFLKSSGGKGNKAIAHMNLAVKLDGEGKADEAMREYKEAIRISPNFAEAHSNFGVLLRDRGDLDGAIREYRIAIVLKPGLAQAHNNLAIALYFKGSFAEAWKEVYACRKLGLEPVADFVQALSQQMPDPGP